MPASEVPTDGKFRHFCEENRCGQYHVNYSCPPTCGTVEDMAAKLYVGTTALVLKTEWPIESYEDTKTIKDGKLSHNRTMLQLNETLHGLCVGGSCCCLCSPCRMKNGDLPGPAFQLHVCLLRGRGGAVQTLRHGLPVGYEKALLSNSCTAGISLLLPSTASDARVTPNSQICALMICSGVSKPFFPTVERIVFPSSETVVLLLSSGKNCAAHLVRHWFSVSVLTIFRSTSIH